MSCVETSHASGTANHRSTENRAGTAFDVQNPQWLPALGRCDTSFHSGAGERNFESAVRQVLLKQSSCPSTFSEFPTFRSLSPSCSQFFPLIPAFSHNFPLVPVISPYRHDALFR